MCQQPPDPSVILASAFSALRRFFDDTAGALRRVAVKLGFTDRRAAVTLRRQGRSVGWIAKRLGRPKRLIGSWLRAAGVLTWAAI